MGATLKDITIKQLTDMLNLLPYQKSTLRMVKSIRYCKMQFFDKMILGTIYVPNKDIDDDEPLTFVFFIKDNLLYVASENEHLNKMICDSEVSDPLIQLLYILETLIQDDLLYLVHIEKELDSILDKTNKDTQFDSFYKIMKYRRKLSKFISYYEQLINIAKRLDTVKEESGWQDLIEQLKLLHNHANSLKEDTIQLQELMNSSQAAKQNHIMIILTIVTTIFLPLTLLTGWYGMNFKNMPELSWQYGYPLVIVISIIIIIIEIIYFKKKRLF